MRFATYSKDANASNEPDIPPLLSSGNAKEEAAPGGQSEIAVSSA